MLRWLLLKFTFALIWLYQRTISFDHGLLRKFSGAPRCKYYPTCSQYAKGALLKHGIIRGTLKIVGRLLRCNPWNTGGVDEP